MSHGHKKVFYSLVVFDCRLDLQTANVIRVDVHCEVTPSTPETSAGERMSTVFCPLYSILQE